MHTSIGAQHYDSTARQYKIRMIDEWGIAKYNATWYTVNF